MIKNFTKNIPLIIICSIVLIYTCFYLYIGFYNRFHTDDLIFLNFNKTKGIIGNIKFHYYYWEVNISYFLSMFSIELFKKANLVFYHIFLFFSNLISFYLLLDVFLKKFFDIKLVKTELLILSAFIISNLYFNCSGYGTVIYWWLSSFIYAFVINFLFLALYFLIKGGKWNFIFACIFIVLWSNTRLNYVLSFIAIAATIALIKSFEQKKLVIFKKQKWFFFSFIFGLILYLSIPGVFKRFLAENRGNQEEQINYFFLFYSGIFDWLQILFSKRNEFLMAVIIFCYASLSGLNKKLKPLFKIKYFGYILLCYTSAVLAQIFTMVVAIKHPIGGDRTLFLLDLMSILVIAYITIFLSSKIKLHKITSLSILIIFSGALIFQIFRYNLREIPMAKAYAEANDKRIALLQEINKRDNPPDTVFVKPLPLSDILTGGLASRGDIDTCNGIYNRSIQHIYDLNFIIIRK